MRTLNTWQKQSGLLPWRTEGSICLFALRTQGARHILHYSSSSTRVRAGVSCYRSNPSTWGLPRKVFTRELGGKWVIRNPIMKSTVTKGNKHRNPFRDAYAVIMESKRLVGYDVINSLVLTDLALKEPWR